MSSSTISAGCARRPSGLACCLTLASTSSRVPHLRSKGSRRHPGLRRRRARCDRVAADPFLRVDVRDQAREGQHGRLCDRIVGETCAGALAGGRGDALTIALRCCFLASRAMQHGGRGLRSSRSTARPEPNRRHRARRAGGCRCRQGCCRDSRPWPNRAMVSVISRLRLTGQRERSALTCRFAHSLGAPT